VACRENVGVNKHHNARYGGHFLYVAPMKVLKDCGLDQYGINPLLPPSYRESQLEFGISKTI
jgi:hypothetical protein